MAVIRQPSTDGAGTSYIRVLADELGTNQISILTIHCSNGQSYNATIEGGTTGNYRSTTQTFTGLNSGQSYSFWGTGKTTGGSAINIPSISFSTTVPTPVYPSTPSVATPGVSGKSIQLTITANANTTGVQIRPSWTGVTDNYAVSSGSTIFPTFTVPSYATSYYFEIRSYNTDYFGTTWVTKTFVSGGDVVAPTISISSITGSNSIIVNWTASDDNALRIGDRYQVYIGTANGSISTIQSKGYTNNTTFEFQFDGNNSPFVIGALYRVRITVYDAANNTAFKDTSVYFSKTRPDSFSWTTTKTPEGMNNLTAEEWNKFLDAINGIKAYKNIAVSTFNRNVGSGAISGYVELTAASYNQARNAINTPGMNPAIATPGQVEIGQRINASHLNNIVTSLNSVA
jgi:hypothetical protein